MATLKLIEIDGDRLRGLLAFCVAQTVNAVRMKADRPDCGRMTHADLLADALKLDMASCSRRLRRIISAA